MSKAGLYKVVLFFMVMPLFFVQQTGCSKDYSFEGADTLSTRDTIILSDTAAPVMGEFAACALCNENAEITTGRWSFKAGNTFFCGATTNSGFIGTNLTFTFFGPSSCSIDSGIVITVYLPRPFSENEFNVSTSSVAFYYYDHHSTQHMFISRSSSTFKVNIESYFIESRIATGTFEGTAYRPNGTPVYIKEGKYKVYLK